MKGEKKQPVNLLLQRPVLPLQEVHVDSERYVLNHHHPIRNCNTSQKQVYRVAPHIFVGQHQYVHHVEDGSQNAESNCQVSMDGFVHSLKFIKLIGQKYYSQT